MGFPKLGRTALILQRKQRELAAALHQIRGGAVIASEFADTAFADVLSERVELDPSRNAAQIVTGVGLVFVRRDGMRGLTSAAVVRLTSIKRVSAERGRTR
jgi:putative Mg2+ transporter-C (MgtC) family protein